MECPSQKYTNSPAMRRVDPSPWQLSTKVLVGCIVSLQGRFPQLESIAMGYVNDYMDHLESQWPQTPSSNGIVDGIDNGNTSIHMEASDAPNEGAEPSGGKQNGLKLNGLTNGHAESEFNFLHSPVNFDNHTNTDDISNSNDDGDSSEIHHQQLQNLPDLNLLFPSLFSLQGFLQGIASTASCLSSEQGFGLFQRLQKFINPDLLLQVETGVSHIRSNFELTSPSLLWYISFVNHSSQEDRGGAILVTSHLVDFTRALAARFVGLDASCPCLIDPLLASDTNTQLISGSLSSQEGKLLEAIRDFAWHQIESLDQGSDYIELISKEKVSLTFAMKSSCLEIVALSVFHKLLDPEVAAKFVDNSLTKPNGHEDLIVTVFKLGSFLAINSHSSIIHNLNHSLPSIVISSGYSDICIRQISKAVIPGLKSLSQDVVVSLIYTLVNMLSADTDISARSPVRRRTKTNETSQGSVFTNGLVSNYGKHQSIAFPAGVTFTLAASKHIVSSAITIAKEYNDSQVSSLVSTILAQKIGKFSTMVDANVLMGLSELSLFLSEREFNLIFRLLMNAEGNAFRENDKELLSTIQNARLEIARKLAKQPQNPLYNIYLADLLTAIVSKGDVVTSDHHRSHSEISVTAEEIVLLLPPLAELLPKSPESPYETGDWNMISLFRNAWFNMVVNGFSKTSEWTLRNQRYLEVIARSTPPLVSETSANQVESELDLNTVLRRGSSNHNVNNQKEIMSSIFSVHNFEFRTISYHKLMFLSATVLLESLRANVGSCSKILLYFGDPDFRSGEFYKYMSHIAVDVTKLYITNVIKGGKEEFTISKVSEELKEMFILCCHRVQAIQEVSYGCCDLVVNAVPAALCREVSLYALLDLLTLVWTSCLDAETDQYEPRTTFVSESSNIKLELSDSYDQRRENLNKLLSKARLWVESIVQVMSYDLKNLLTVYLSRLHEMRANDVALGCTFALEMGGKISQGDGELNVITGLQPAFPASTASEFLSQYIWRMQLKEWNNSSTKQDGKNLKALKSILDPLISDTKHNSSFNQLKFALAQSSKYLKMGPEGIYIVRAAVKVPFIHFNEKYISQGTSLWLWIMNFVPELRASLYSQLAMDWLSTVVNHKGIYSQQFDPIGPEYDRMEYSPSNKLEVEHAVSVATRAFAPHLILIRFLSSTFQASLYESKHILKIFTQIVTVGLQGLKYASLSPLAREVRFELIKFALDVSDAHARISANIKDSFRDLIISSALTWFDQICHWPFGGNRLKLRFEVSLLMEIFERIDRWSINPSSYNSFHQVAGKKNLLLLFLNDELTKMSAWLDPLQREPAKKLINLKSMTLSDAKIAWSIQPSLAVRLVHRYKKSDMIAVLQQLIANDPIKVINVAEALEYFMNNKDGNISNHPLLYWKEVSPIESINLFLPSKGSDSYILQFAMRSLEYHDVNITFFYVPQIVQSLRYDKNGYVERFIQETAKLSQLFAHQIIWNIKANSYKDEDSEVPDPMKPTLDRVVEKLIANFDDDARSFYEREFSFFNEVTSISGKLKPYIKKTKTEKKAKIDEEINKIKVDVGVYLPSNPDGVVVDIDRKSGRPLQSHAKAPFLAKFKIRRQVDVLEDNLGEDGSSNDDDEVQKKTVDVWQGAIFKVGDDCRQDVLAIQIIAIFRSIFKFSGLDLYVYPYRVTATAPGCGVIDVLPNSISRDMLGREAVNGLYEYFTSKHGGEDSIDFQKARNNFVKSHAAYSVISYLIQFKDRHNGNIMYDDQGHILHIDFGFCFDIVPGGVKFEAAPFKLTHEMVQVMGGSVHTQAYKWFEELCVKAFLASRPYAEVIIQAVLPMLDSGLPCFKGESTIKKLRARFVLEKSEAEAAIFFKSLIKKSFESIYTKGYDEFQRITNGIPVSSIKPRSDLTRYDILLTSTKLETFFSIYISLLPLYVNINLLWWDNNKPTHRLNLYNYIYLVKLDFVYKKIKKKLLLTKINKQDKKRSTYRVHHFILIYRYNYHPISAFT